MPNIQAFWKNIAMIPSWGAKALAANLRSTINTQYCLNIKIAFFSYSLFCSQLNLSEILNYHSSSRLFYWAGLTSFEDLFSLICNDFLLERKNKTKAIVGPGERSRIPTETSCGIGENMRMRDQGRKKQQNTKRIIFYIIQYLNCFDKIFRGFSWYFQNFWRHKTRRCVPNQNQRKRWVCMQNFKLSGAESDMRPLTLTPFKFQATFWNQRRRLGWRGRNFPKNLSELRKIEWKRGNLYLKQNNTRYLDF